MATQFEKEETKCFFTEPLFKKDIKLIIYNILNTGNHQKEREYTSIKMKITQK